MSLFLALAVLHNFTGLCCARRAGPAPSDDDDDDDDDDNNDDDDEGVGVRGDNASHASDEEEREQMEEKPHPGAKDGRGWKSRGSVPAAQLGRHTAAHPSVRTHAPEVGGQGFPQAKAAPARQGHGGGSHDRSHEAGQPGVDNNNNDNKQ
jgi:hypothetical protein